MDLGSLNIESIENILGSMSSDEMENLKNAAEQIFSSMGEKTQKEPEKEKTKDNPFSGFDIDFETVSRIMSLMNRMKNQPEDPRCTLLLSLKPMLSEKRRHKVDEAVKMLSLFSFLPIINELGGN